jgi:hypothetical protein
MVRARSARRSRSRPQTRRIRTPTEIQKPSTRWGERNNKRVQVHLKVSRKANTAIPDLRNTSWEQCLLGHWGGISHGESD